MTTRRRRRSREFSRSSAGKRPTWAKSRQLGRSSRSACCGASLGSCATTGSMLLSCSCRIFRFTARRGKSALTLSSAGVAQLAAELDQIDAVLGGFSRAEKNDWDIVVVACPQFRIFVDVDFGEARAELFQQGSDLRLGFFAEMAAGA